MRFLLAALSLAACTYEAEKPAVSVHIDGVPAEVDHLDVRLSDSTTTDPAHPKFERFPHFGLSAQPSIDLVFPEPASGAYHVDVDAFGNGSTAAIAKGHSDPAAAYPATTSVQVRTKMFGTSAICLIR